MYKTTSVTDPNGKGLSAAFVDLILSLIWVAVFYTVQVAEFITSANLQFVLMLKSSSILKNGGKYTYKNAPVLVAWEPVGYIWIVIFVLASTLWDILYPKLNISSLKLYKNEPLSTDDPTTLPWYI